MKFGRTYNLTIEVENQLANQLSNGNFGRNNVVIISYPLTLNFNVSRTTQSTNNIGKFRIYNLSPDTRKLIFHDRVQIDQYRQIILQAGYETEPKLPIIFQGNINYAYSYREGPDWITEIEAFDGGFATINGNVSMSVPQGWNLQQLIETIISTMPHVEMGAVSNFRSENSRGLTLMGNSWDVIGKLTGNSLNFIDNEKAYVIKNNEYVNGIQGILKLSSESGILNSPRRFNNQVDVDILFEPRIVVGQILTLESNEPYNNGEFVVVGVSHRGIISGAINGQAITTLNLWLGTEALQPVKAAAN